MDSEQPKLTVMPAGSGDLAQNTDRQYYPALDGLRGVAILSVLAFHNFGFLEVFFLGWLGVDLFFVLSGFLITDILLRTLGSKNYLANFYTRRILRIFPLYYLSLILFLIVLPRLNPPFDLSYYTDNQAWLWTYTQNWLFAFKDSDGANSLHYLWSLSIEEQFYLIWPLIILAVRKPRYLLSFIIVLLIVTAGLRLWVWDKQFTNISYFNLYTFTRIDGICIGCAVALLRHINRKILDRNSLSIILILACLKIAFHFITRAIQPGLPYLAITGYVTFAILFGILVNLCVKGNNKLINFIFSIPPLKFFGRISYGLYIFHWPVHLCIIPYLYPLVARHTSIFTAQIIVSIVTVAVAVGISWLSYRYYESYFLRLKKKFA